MKMGEYIKKLRTESNLTQEELGKKLNPGVNRAAINKWENGRVKNIKRSYIEQMSKIFGVKPSELMCFSQEEIIENEVKAIESVQNTFGDDYVKLLELFHQLNEDEQQELLNYLQFKVCSR